MEVGALAERERTTQGHWTGKEGGYRSGSSRSICSDGHSDIVSEPCQTVVQRVSRLKRVCEAGLDVHLACIAITQAAHTAITVCAKKTRNMSEHKSIEVRLGSSGRNPKAENRDKPNERVAMAGPASITLSWSTGLTEM